MDDEELNHLMRLREAQLKRLYILELKQARMGNTAPADIVLEIEELRAKIKEKDDQIAQLPKTGTTQSAINNSQTVTITLQVKANSQELTEETRNAILKVLSELGGVSPEQITILTVTPG